MNDYLFLFLSFFQEEKEELDWIPKGPKETVHYKEAYYANKPRIYKGVLLDDSKTVEKVVSLIYNFIKNGVK